LPPEARTPPARCLRLFTTMAKVFQRVAIV
jgi:hypothetical protein